MEKKVTPLTKAVERLFVEWSLHLICAFQAAFQNEASSEKLEKFKELFDPYEYFLPGLRTEAGLLVSQTGELDSNLNIGRFDYNLLLKRFGGKENLSKLSESAQAELLFIIGFSFANMDERIFWANFKEHPEVLHIIRMYQRVYEDETDFQIMKEDLKEIVSRLNHSLDTAFAETTTWNS